MIPPIHTLTNLPTQSIPPPKFDRPLTKPSIDNSLLLPIPFIEATPPSPSLSSIPPLLFSPTFDLRKPAKFTAIKSTPDLASLLPSVESHLHRLLSTNQTQFSDSLDTLATLSLRTETIFKRIQSVETEMASRPDFISVLLLQKRLQVMQLLKSNGTRVNQVYQLTSFVKILLERKEWVAALAEWKQVDQILRECDFRECKVGVQCALIVKVVREEIINSLSNEWKEWLKVGENEPGFLSVYQEMDGKWVKEFDDWVKESIVAIKSMTALEKLLKTKGLVIQYVRSKLNVPTFVACYESCLKQLNSAAVQLIESADVSHMKFGAFKSWYEGVNSVVETEEKITGSVCFDLRHSVSVQAKKFIAHAHEYHVTMMTSTVDRDNWKQVKVAPEYQSMVNEMIERKHAHNSDEICLNGETFFCVNSTLVAVHMLHSYVDILNLLNLHITDVTQKTIEFLMSFNERVNQIILGAGAIMSAGLKSITAKHMCLSHSTIGCVMSLVRIITPRLCPQTSHAFRVLQDSLNRMQKDFTGHLTQIEDKLISLMLERAHYHIDPLCKQDWEKSENVLPEISKLISETNTLAKVISKFIRDHTARVFDEIFENYRVILMKMIDEAVVTSSAAKANLFLNMSELVKGVEEIGRGLSGDLEGAVNNKSIKVS